MFSKRIKFITNNLSKFTGTHGEPKNGDEFYILKSMWVMMLSEFEGSIKSLAENYIDKIKKKKIDKIHICILLQSFHPNADEGITLNNIISISQKDPKNITYQNFTGNKKPKYKSASVTKLFNSLGIFFQPIETAQLKLLDSMASTRDSIAHGNNQIQITRKEIQLRILELDAIFKMLKKKLSN